MSETIANWPDGVTDAHAALALATDFDGYDQADAFVVAFEGPSATSKGAMDAQWIAFTTKCASLMPTGASVQFHPHWWSDAFQFYGTATVSRAGLAAFAQCCLQKLISRWEFGLEPVDQRPRWAPFSPSVGAGVNTPKLCEAEVLYGVVDFGCPFAHEKLRTVENSTRLLNFWDQGTSQALGRTTAPVDFGFGVCAAESDINVLTVAHFPASLATDQGLIYASLNQPALAQRASHGAHMLGLLLDSNVSLGVWARSKDAAPPLADGQRPALADLVFVQLPANYQQGMPRSAFGPNRLAAMRYILSCAGSKTQSVVVPISSEIWDGSHDGDSLFVKALDALVEYAASELGGKILKIYVAVGNSQRAFAHSQGKLTDEGAATLTVRLPPGCERHTFAECWLPTRSVVTSVTLKPPAPQQPLTLNFAYGSGGVVTTTSGISVVVDPSRTNSSGTCVLIRFAPTLALSQVDSALCGDWRVTVNTTGIAPQAEFFAYIARSFHGVGGKRRTYQAHFPSALVNAFLPSPVMEEFPDYASGSVNGMAGGARITAVVGGYRLYDLKRAPYSSAGPGRQGARIVDYAVDCAAPSDESPGRLGLRSWGNAGAVSVRMAGTSVATPLAARVLNQSGVVIPKPTNNSRADPQLVV